MSARIVNHGAGESPAPKIKATRRQPVAFKSEASTDKRTPSRLRTQQAQQAFGRLFVLKPGDPAIGRVVIQCSACWKKAIRASLGVFGLYPYDQPSEGVQLAFCETCATSMHARTPAGLRLRTALSALALCICLRRRDEREQARLEIASQQQNGGAA